MRLGSVGAALAALMTLGSCGGGTDSTPTSERAPRPVEVQARSPESPPSVPGSRAPEGGKEAMQSPAPSRPAAKQRSAPRNLTVEDVERLLREGDAGKGGGSGGSELPPAIEEILQEADVGGSADRKADEQSGPIDRILEEIGQR